MTDQFADLRAKAEAADEIVLYTYGKPEADLDIRDTILRLLDRLERSESLQARLVNARDRAERQAPR